MEPPAKSSPKERSETDQSLRAERSKTDEELDAARAAIQEDADEVVAVARERAEALLRAARERTDRELSADVASPAVLREVAAERVDEDRALTEEHETADEQLEAERAQRRAAITALLQLEREDTDDRLLVERTHADQTVATRDEFLGMVSHDLRTLLGGIAMNTALLANHARELGDLGRETLRHTDRIQRFATRMNRLVGDLIDVVSLDAGKLAVSPRALDAVQVVQDAIEASLPVFSAKGVTLTSEVASDALLAQFDQERVLQVLTNLLSNALKFTEPGGRVSVSVEAFGPEVRFSVTDSGIGIPAHELQSIFERFRQVRAKDRRGLGLGLYIARCIVEAHGGRIWAELPARGGSALHFTLPGAAN